MGAKIIVDCSAYQSDTLEFFNNLKSHGVFGVIIKLTEGSNPGSAYLNPRAKAQYTNAKKAGLKICGFYHYARFWGNADARNEAKWFIQGLKDIGVTSKEAVMVCDAEDLSLNSSIAGLTSDVNAFLNYLKDSGYSKVDTYSGAYYFKSRMYRNKLVSKNLWVASYGSASAGISCGTWQFTDNYKGLKVDASLDYSGYYSNVKNGAISDGKPSYYSWTPYMVTALSKINIYKTVNFKAHKPVRSYNAGTDFKIKKIVKSNDKVPHFLTDSGFYITANKDLVKNTYYVDNPKEVKTLKTVWLHSDLPFKVSNRVKGTKYSRGTYFNIAEIKDIGHGLTALKTDSGYWLSANKHYVKKV